MERRDHPGIHVPPPLVFVAGFVAGLFLHRVYPAKLLPATFDAVRIAAGWVLIGAWPLLTGWAIWQFRQARTTIMPNRPSSALVTSGPYAWTRNPMYVGMTLIYLGLSLLVNTIWALLVLPGVLGAVHLWIIPREERHLSGKFGDVYESYRARVRRWL